MKLKLICMVISTAALVGIFLIELEARTERHVKDEAAAKEAARQQHILDVQMQGQAIIGRHNRVAEYVQNFPKLLENINVQEKINWITHSNAEQQRAEAGITYSNALNELDEFSSNYPPPPLYPKH
jgi:hypothetical protein